MSIITSADRIFIEENKHEFYEQLRKKGKEDPDNYPFYTMKDIFMLSVFLGKQRNAYEPLSTKTKDIFQGDVFNAQTDVPVLAAIAFDNVESIEELTDAKKLLEIAQAYANGGIGHLMDEVVNSHGKSNLFNLVNLVLR